MFSSLLGVLLAKKPRKLGLFVVEEVHSSLVTWVLLKGKNKFAQFSFWKLTNMLVYLSGTGDSQCDSRQLIFARIIRDWNPNFYSTSGRFAWITRIFDSRKSPDSRESCEPIHASHATKLFILVLCRPQNTVLLDMQANTWNVPVFGGPHKFARDCLFLEVALVGVVFIPCWCLRDAWQRGSNHNNLPPPPGSELMVIWKGWFETVPCRATLATPFPPLCPRILGTRFTNYGLRMFWGELMVIWKGWFETVPCRAALNTPFSALCPRIPGTRFTSYGLRVSGKRTT